MTCLCLRDKLFTIYCHLPHDGCHTALFLALAPYTVTNFCQNLNTLMLDIMQTELNVYLRHYGDCYCHGHIKITS